MARHHSSRIAGAAAGRERRASEPIAPRVPAAPPPEGSTLRECLAVLGRRKWILLAVFVATAGAAAARVFLTPPTYTARTSIALRFGREFIYPSEVSGFDSSKTFSLEQMVNSEVEILRSRDLARHVVDDLGAEKLYPDLDGLDPRTVTARAADRFLQRLSVTPVFESSIIRATFDHTDPELASRALETLLDRLKDKHLEVFGGKRVQFLENQVAKQRAELLAAQEKLRSFKLRNTIYDIPTQRTALLAERTEIQAELRQTKQRSGELAHIQRSLESDGPLPRDVLNDRRFADERSALMTRRSELESLIRGVRFRAAELAQEYRSMKSKSTESLRFTAEAARQRAMDDARIRLLELELKERDLLRTHREDSRDVKTVREEIRLVREFLKERQSTLEKSAKEVIRDEWNVLRHRLKTLKTQLAETDDALRSLESRERALHLRAVANELEIVESNQEALSSELAALENRLTDLESMQTELGELERDASAREVAFQMLLERLQESKTMEELDEQRIVNLRVIEAPFPPVAPSGLPRRVQVAIGAVVGLLAGVAAAFFLELLSR